MISYLLLHPYQSWSLYEPSPPELHTFTKKILDHSYHKLLVKDRPVMLVATWKSSTTNENTVNGR